MTLGLRGRVTLIAAGILLTVVTAIVLMSGYFFGGALSKAQMLRATLAAGAAIALIGLALLYRALSRYVSEPLEQMVRSIERFRGGAPGQALRVPAAGGSELEIMVRGFNGLLDRIAARERELVAAKEAAEAANRTKSEFLAMMSHELRTPMNAVLGMAELLDNTQLTARQQRFLDNIKSGSQSLLHILDDILNFARVEMGELTVQHAPFALPRMVERTVSLLQETARGRGLTLEVQLDAALPAVVIGDAGRTRQILINLLANSLKFTERGGVMVRVAPSLGTRIRFTVSDTGIGIDPSFRGSLYRAFTQQDSGYARKYGGTGLGLAIVKRLCDALEGSIDMESTPGKGSTFWFELPLPVAAEEPHDARATVAREPAEPVALPTTPTPAVPVPGKRVLVVEDNRLNQELVVGYLEDSAFEVTLATDGRIGVDLYSRESFDVVLMDWQMPEMDGIEATRAIRALEQARGSKRTPVIAMTAHAMPGDREACLAAGMDDYLVKPYSLQELLDALHRWTAG